MKVAHVSTFPPMRCGIAFYVADLIESLPESQHSKYPLHYGSNMTPDAAGSADVSNVNQLEQLARCISDSDCDVVSLQHEFGIWGGANGEHILSFLDGVQKPMVSTLHTTFGINDRPTVQASILRRLIDQSASSVVLTDDSRETLCRALGRSSDTVHVVPHGVPEIPFSDPNRPYNCGDAWQLCSVGFFRPDKGVERTIEALAILRQTSQMRFRYIVAGSHQPQFDGQIEYRRRLRDQIAKLGFSDTVIIDDRFLSRGEQIALIRSSHAGIFSYQTPFQCSSGTIPLVLSAGRPVICTPFEFARAKRTECGEGVVLARNFSSEAIAEGIETCFAAEAIYRSRIAAVRGKADRWTWQNVGVSYCMLFAEAKGEIGGNLGGLGGGELRRGE